MTWPFGGENILQPVATPNIQDPMPGTDEYGWAQMRDRSTYDLGAMPWLPKTPDSDEWAKELYDRVEEAERAYAAPNLLSNDYILGTASKPDDVGVEHSLYDINEPYVFSAEHATSPIRLGETDYRFPDRGTGGLAAVMAQDYGTAVIARGRQTTNVPSVEKHPFKDRLKEELVRATGFIAVHGKNPGMFVHPSDQAEIHACLGLGLNPPEPTQEFAEKVILAARDDLGLYVVNSNKQPAYIQKPNSTEIKRLENGNPKLSQLAGLKPTMTVNFAREQLAKQGRSGPSLQIELTDLLRLSPVDSKTRKDKKAQIIGVALGYKLLEKVVQLTLLETANQAQAKW